MDEEYSGITRVECFDIGTSYSCDLSRRTIGSIIEDVPVVSLQLNSPQNTYIGRGIQIFGSKSRFSILYRNATCKLEKSRLTCKESDVT